jgi:hypothetical protein
LVVNKFKAVKIPPLGPSLYLGHQLHLSTGSVDILLHDLFVVDCVPDIDICAIWHVRNGRVEIKDIRRGSIRV